MEEVNIKELLNVIKEKIWIIFIAVGLSLITTIIYINTIKKPIYKSSTTYILVSDKEDDGITSSDVTLNEKLIATYKEMIKSRTVIDKVITNLKLEGIETVSSIASNISVEQVSTSSMIKITITNKDPEIAKKIAENIGKEFTKEAEEKFKKDNLELMDPPLVPSGPANSSNTKEIILINGASVFVALMIIFLIYYFDNGVKSIEQVEEKIDLPVLGSTPLISKKEKSIEENELIVHYDPKSPISEGIRTIRTNLQFATVNGNLKTIMVTSSMPGEGKSFTSANLAVAFAQDGNKVLLIDCDMRKGRLNKIFNIGNNKGLSNLLIDNIEKNYKKYIKKTDIKNLSVIPSGVVPPNPSELLNSDANKELIKILEQEYDYIIFDCVPINGLPDSLIMAGIVDKTLIVCSEGKTPIDLLQKTKNSLQNVDTNIAGIIVNKTKNKYNKYYGHYYG